MSNIASIYGNKIVPDNDHRHNNKNVLDQITNVANIKKNPGASNSDIIDRGYLIVGSGSMSPSTAGMGAFLSGGYLDSTEYPNKIYHAYSSPAILGGYSNVIHYGYRTAIIGGEYNTIGRITANSVIVGGEHNQLGDENTTAFNGPYGQNSAIIAGEHIRLLGDSRLGTGMYNNSDVECAFVIGNGTADDARSNAFRVTRDGSVYGMSAFNSTGADYAEYFEWSDGNPDNEDRRGLFVVIDEEDKIRIASSGDEGEIIGVISSMSSVIGNAYDDQWQGMYLTDIYGEILTKTVHHEAEYSEFEVPDIDEDGNELETTHTETVCTHGEYDAEEYVINPDYDNTQKYIPRSERKEWAVVGMVGQIITTDDGSCTVGGYCTVGANGIGTSTEDKSIGYKVLKRLDDTHVKILMR